MNVFIEENMYFQNCNTRKQIVSNSYGSVGFIRDGLNRHSVGFRDNQIQVSSCSDNSIKTSKKEFNYLLNCRQEPSSICVFCKRCL